MKNFALGIVLLLALVSLAVTAPPNCETTRINGTNFENCSRSDIGCGELAEEQVKHPSDQWYGCAWPVRITRSSYAAAGLTMYDTEVMVVPHFKDSERFDIQVIFEKPYCNSKIHEFKNEQIAIHDGVPYVTVGFTCLQSPSEVPTVEAREKGGKKEVTHSYK